MTHHVLLAFNDANLEQEMIAYLPSSYEVTLFRTNHIPAQMPPICIFDLETWEEVTHKIKNFEETYRVLLIPVEDLVHLPQIISYQVDEILTLPLHPLELEIRLRNLLRMNNHSQHQQLIYENLATTTKALDSTSDSIIIADQDGVTIYVNPAFSKLFGYTTNELNVAGIPNLLFQEATVGDHIFRLVRENGSWNGEVELKTKGRNNLLFMLNIDSIIDNHQNTIGFITICTDITQQQKLRAIQSEQHKLAKVQLDTLRALTSTLDLAEVFDRILNNISEVVPNDAANIILIQGDNVQMVDRDDYSDHALLEELKTGKLTLQHFDDLRKIRETGEPLVIPNTSQYLYEHNNMKVRTPWLNSHIGIPIRLQNKIIGFLNVDSIQAGLFTAAHAIRLQLFAEQAAIAIQNARTSERVKRVAMLEERQRLARNLHDAVSQTLFSANIIAENLPVLWEQHSDEVLPRLEQIRTLNRGALAEMRTLLLELHPERLLETKISTLLQQLVEGILGQTYLRVNLDVEEHLELPANLHEAVYYITQEALNNVIKHADAHHVIINLKRCHEMVKLFISDNGHGFDLDQIAPKNLGLYNIRQRAQATEAHLDIQSMIGEGTQISVNWTL